MIIAEIGINHNGEMQIAKNLIDMANAINKSNCNAAAASSIFLFKNKDYDSIMINYPTQLQLNSLFE